MQKRWINKGKGRGRGTDYRNSNIIIADDEREDKIASNAVSEDNNRLSMPRERNSETLVADPRVVPGTNTWYKQVQVKKEPTIRGGLKSLQDRGLKITSYSESGGSGNPITEDDEYE